MSKNSMNSNQIVGAIALAVFFLALLLLLFAGDYGFIASFFMSALIAILTAIIIYLALVTSDQSLIGSTSKKPDAISGGTVTPGASVAGAAAIPPDATTGKAAKRDTDKSSADKAAAEAKAAEAANKKETTSPTSLGSPEPEPAPEATPANPPAGALGEDYDGDGVHEGTDEGTRPKGLDAPRDGQADDLKEIKGVGPKLEQLCNSLGFWHFDQVASWTDEEVAWVDANLTGFKGRVSRDKWVEQAKVLASGGDTEFSKRVEDGDVY